VRLAAAQPQMLDDSADDLRVFDAGDDLHRPAALLAGFDLDAEDAFEPLRPAHRYVLRRLGPAISNETIPALFGVEQRPP